jgi:hypothetical protein
MGTGVKYHPLENPMVEFSSSRHIEVKLKCKPADSPSTVTLYLLEPKTCEYVLGTVYYRREFYRNYH